MIVHDYFWIGFTLFVLAMLALDLGVFHRSAHEVKFKEALSWTCVWSLMACAFGAWVWSQYGRQFGVEFFTGYLIELALSADNVFVFAIIFSYFHVPRVYQHKVLFWGVLSALVLRFIMITVGAALIKNFAWIIYVFGVFLIITGLRMLFGKDEKIEPEKNPVVRLFKKMMPVTNEYHGDHFFTRANGILMATPMMVVLVCVEISDVIFAVDSIPAIFAITKEPFIVFTSNVFAIMGLRSLYFVLDGVMDKFHFLKVGLGLVLTFIGVKMLLGHTPYAIPTIVSLFVVAGVIGGSIVASLIWPKPILDEEPDGGAKPVS